MTLADYAMEVSHGSTYGIHMVKRIRVDFDGYGRSYATVYDSYEYSSRHRTFVYASYACVSSILLAVKP